MSEPHTRDVNVSAPHTRNVNVSESEFPTSQNFYEGDVQVWRPYSRFPRGLGTRLTKSRVCRS